MLQVMMITDIKLYSEATTKCTYQFLTVCNKVLQIFISIFIKEALFLPVTPVHTSCLFIEDEADKIQFALEKFIIRQD